MKHLFCTLLAATCVAIGSPIAQAQTRKPVPKPAAKPVAKPAPKPAPAVAARPATPPPPPPAAPAPAATPTNSPFAVGSSVINLGVGLGSRYGYTALYGGNTSVTPAISVSFERGIIPLGPGVLGVGVFAGYQSASYEYSTFKDKYTDIIVMVRGAFHYPVSDEFDAYAGLGLGVRHLGYSSNYTGPYAVDYGTTGAASGLFVGGRYYFTPGIGAFAELGYDQSYLKIGLSAKF
ncbi:porin family protein [Hymenobacter rubidus]|uniref:hypothetical protein n=1 Tax=Hymenobacter rubidus TaxID=1441626 RepID=UPI00191EE055|nr:hypothetical protein [Hymenobacter rubidus]